MVLCVVLFIALGLLVSGLSQEYLYKSVKKEKKERKQIKKKERILLLTMFGPVSAILFLFMLFFAKEIE